MDCKEKRKEKLVSSLDWDGLVKDESGKGMSYVKLMN
jgi:hypothetical protein